MRRLHRLLAFGALVITPIVSGEVRAAPIAFNFSGTVRAVIDLDNLLAGTGIAALSSTFTGTFSYDPASSPTGGGAGFSNYAGISMTALLDGTFGYSHFGPTLQVINDHASFDDALSSAAAAPSFTQFDTPTGDSAYNIQLFLQDSTAAVFSDTSLPASLNFSNFDLGGGPTVPPAFDIRAFNTNGTSYQILGEVTSLSVVPEPSIALLLGSGVLGIAARRRRKGTNLPVI